MKLTCQKLTSLLSELRQQKRVFDATINVGDLDKAKGMQLEIEDKVAILHEEIWDFPELPLVELKKDYVSQTRILERSGLLRSLESIPGKIGIRGLNGREYTYPEFSDVKKQIARNRDILRPKMQQGFTKLQITPFGCSVAWMISALSTVIVRHCEEGKIFAPKNNPSDPNEQLVALEVNTSDPVWAADPSRTYRFDETGEMVYFPENFEAKEHGGKTKKQILSKRGGVFSGFIVSLIESDIDIPGGGERKMVGDRLKFDSYEHPERYLDLIKSLPQYAHEHGLTLEEWITQFIIHLEETNQVIDDWQGNGRVCCNLGSYYTESREVSCAAWHRGFRRVELDRVLRRETNFKSGTRTAVRIDQPKPKTSVFKRILNRVTK
ncbi:hypothetical protein EPO05_05120 [Patescibacteria group bacterium]|nr:MAG: hypothetical protein EPO05_05120 [Patescibacteria group bacterium]